MNQSEITAFNSGVLTVLELAKSTAATMESLMVLKPTRYNFAAEALRALAEEGRALLKSDGSVGVVVSDPSPSPRPPKSNGYELIVPAHAGDDGKFGLTEDEIIHPSREIIVGWLSGRYPMQASHWSKIAARMLSGEAAEPTIVVAVASTNEVTPESGVTSLC